MRSATVSASAALVVAATLTEARGGSREQLPEQREVNTTQWSSQQQQLLLH